MAVCGLTSDRVRLATYLARSPVISRQMAKPGNSFWSSRRADTSRAAAPKAAKRAFFDYYLVLTGRNESFVVESQTVEDPPRPVRKLVEDVIRTIQPGRSQPS